MSEQNKSFDEVLRSKLGEHSVTPPSSVWENIEAKRNFGHVVANRISINWRTFGTMLLMLLGGGSSVILFGGEDVAKEVTNSNQIANEQKQELSLKQTNQTTILNTKKETSETKNEDEEFSQEQNTIINTTFNRIPDAELIASISQAGFSRPQNLMDERLASYINNLDGWESAKPVAFVHYYHMQEAPSLDIHKKVQNQEPKSQKLKQYDYVKNDFVKRSFRERSTILIAFNPQSITKSMEADFNLSSTYLNHRLNSEKTRMAYSLEVNLHYELKNNKFFETGINYTKIYEEMSFKGEKRFSNEYNFFEVPLLLGYEDRNAKWGWHIKGGLGIQIHNVYDGYIYKIYQEEGVDVDPEPTGDAQFRLNQTETIKTIIGGDHKLSANQDPNEVLDLEKESENPFKARGVVNFHLAAGLTYFHSIKTSFVITPYYKRSLNSITKEEALFSERITYMGISIGTRIKF